MIDRSNERPLTGQAKALGISRGSVYYLARPTSDADLALMRRIDALRLEHHAGDPQAENFAAIAGGFLGGVLAPRLLAWARAATISDLLMALGRTAPRPPPGARPPDPPPTQTTEPTPPAA